MLTWLRNGPYLVTDDGIWMMTKRYRSGKLEYELMRSAGNGIWHTVKKGADSQELKQAAEEMEESHVNN